MRISNSFDVPLPLERAWTTLMDIPAVVPCMPGAELTEKIDDRNYKGKVSVRLGPVALSFAGTAMFTERDDAAHTAVVKAQGTDARGRGGANALIRFGIKPKGSGSEVVIDTDLNLSGSVAQYGRGAGMIQSVATQLISQFAKTLEQRIRSSEEVAGPIDPTPASGQSRAHEPVASQPRPPAEPPPVKPIGGFSLVLRAIWASLAGLFRRSP